MSANWFSWLGKSGDPAGISGVSDRPGYLRDAIEDIVFVEGDRFLAQFLSFAAVRRVREGEKSGASTGPL